MRKGLAGYEGGFVLVAAFSAGVGGGVLGHRTDTIILMLEFFSLIFQCEIRFT